MDDQVRYFVSAAVLLALVIGVAAFQHPFKERLDENTSMGSIDMEEVNDSPVTAIFLEDNKTLAQLQLEKADSTSDRRKGLMNRESLENNSGMLFIWEDSSNRSFWMKDTYIPLDMIFVTAGKTIRTIKQADPQPDIKDRNLKRYSSEGPVRYVIETKQDFTQKKGISEGDSVSFNLSD